MKTLNKFIIEKLKFNKDTKIIPVIKSAQNENELAEIICSNWTDKEPTGTTDDLDNFLQISTIYTNNPKNKYIEYKYLTDNYDKNFDMIKVMKLVNKNLSNNDSILSICIYCSENKIRHENEWEQIGRFDPDNENDKYQEDTFWTPDITNNYKFKEDLGIK